MANRQGRNSHPKINRTIDGADIISSMPDEILHHILSFIPTNLSIRTSVLSKRWRHAWRESPRLDFDLTAYIRKDSETTARGIEQTLASYRAQKIMSFSLWMPRIATHTLQLDSLVEFAMSRNVEVLSLTGCYDYNRETYRFPDVFYLSSSLTQLKVEEFNMIPGCTVSWSSLRSLTLSFCYLYDESVANILSGCPKLESLKLLNFSGLLERLDLRKLPSLRTLEMNRRYLSSEPMEIVAQHIHYLSLTSSEERPCTLVDVSSLAEAKLDIAMDRFSRLDRNSFLEKASFLQTMVLMMLAKLQNVERLTFDVWAAFLQILSRAELCGVTFPTLQVQTLTLKTNIARSAIPGIARLLQNSPGLKKLVVQTKDSVDIMHLDQCSDSLGLDSVECWGSKYEVVPTSKEIRLRWGCNDATSKILASFMELVLRNAKTLDTMIVILVGTCFNDAKWFEEMLQMAAILSHNNNVSLVLKRLND